MTLCECGCGETVKPGNRFIYGHYSNKGKRYPRIPLPLCACGCGKKVLYHWNRFLPGHHCRGRGKKIIPVQGPLPLCKCGCGEVVTNIVNQFINHHSRFYKKPPIQGPIPLCECGCGQTVKHPWNRFIKGHVKRGKVKSTPLKTYKYKTSTNDVDYCMMCKSKNVLGTHHIVPRKYGVNNDEYNLITLCKNCHDKVEILTTDWIDSGREYSTLILKRLIVYIW